MTLTDLSAIGSFVSGIAVVVSLVFLTLQIRQTNRNQRSLMQQARTGRIVQSLLQCTDPYLSEILALANADCTALSPAQIWAFYGMVGAIFWSYEDSFMQFRAGTLDKQSWDSDLATIKRPLHNPAYRVVWKMARDGMSGEYRDTLNAMMHDAKAQSGTLTDAWKTYAAEEMAAT
jgi:hypothetical protein